MRKTSWIGANSMREYEMAELWTFSGINSYDITTGEFSDYVEGGLTERGVKQQPARSYVSKLGTGDFYSGDSNVAGLDSESKLDREAREFAEGALGVPEIEPGSFVGKKITVLLVAPKTTTDPPKVPNVDISIYWGPNDVVPNQGLLRPDTIKYWRKFTRGRAHIYVINTSKGGFFGKGHSFGDFMRNDPTTMKWGWKRKMVGGKSKRRRAWKASKRKAPTGPKLINKWLRNSGSDYVFVGHSQGTNILIHCLERGFRSI